MATRGVLLGAPAGEVGFVLPHSNVQDRDPVGAQVHGHAHDGLLVQAGGRRQAEVVLVIAHRQLRRAPAPPAPQHAQVVVADSPAEVR
eukprot:1559688-Pyramimonas_sp.AAC.1